MTVARNSQNLVARLRTNAHLKKDTYATWEEAADEIERLLEEIQQLKHDSTIFINERSDAICENFDLREENAELREENAELREAAIAALKEEEKKDD
jgi:hypothetical protein